MATGLQYKETLNIISGGFTGEIVGSNGVIQNWTDTSGSSGSSTVTYYYRDSYTGQNENSTQVDVTVTDSWTATVDNNNVYHVTVTTVINSISRTVIGNPRTFRATINVKRTANGPVLWSSGSCAPGSINITHGTNINLGSYTFDLPPGQSSQDISTIYYRSNYCGHDFDPAPSIYVDEYAMGVNFRNTLPPDYRPGKILDNSSVWQSHNRTTGADNIYNGSSWKTMRTQYGGSAQGDPPIIRHSADWYNERKIGANQ